MRRKARWYPCHQAIASLLIGQGACSVGLAYVTFRSRRIRNCAQILLL